MHVFAVRDIAAGEQLCLSYLSLETLDMNVAFRCSFFSFSWQFFLRTNFFLRSAQFLSSFGHECACSRCAAERFQSVAAEEEADSRSAEFRWSSFSDSFASAFSTDSANIESFGLEQAGLRLHSNIDSLAADMFPVGSWQEMRMLEWYRKVIQLNSKHLTNCPTEFLSACILRIQCLYQNRIARLGAVATAFLTATRITYLTLLRLMIRKGIIGIVPQGGSLADMKVLVQVLVSLNEAGAHAQ
jgi:hypothetical protein